MKLSFISRSTFIFFVLFMIVVSVQSQNFRKIKKAGIVCLGYHDKSEVEMAEDNEFNRVKVCQGSSADNHYTLKVYHHRGYFHNEIWGTIYGAYSVNVYSSQIESTHPIESNHFNFASFPNKELIDFCCKYMIRDLKFYEDF